MKFNTGVRLALMMLMEYFIWGSWYVTMSTYMKVHLNATDTQIGAAYSSLAIATMISPFFVGMVADRFFSAQRIMGVLHILGAGMLYLATVVDGNSAFYWVILVYSLLYMPTIALSNSIAFNQMTDPGKQFPWIRVFGTLGWIAAGFSLSAFDIETSSSTFMLAAGVSAVLGLFSFALPNTPPRADTGGGSAAKALGTEAFVLFKNKPYLIFFLAAILVCIPLSFYYQDAYLFLSESGMQDAAGKMILGQVSEAIFILAIPFLFYSIGVKRMLILGMAAWILRYFAFAYGDMGSNTWMMYAGIILHGICYDFFFVTGYMYTEKKAGEKIKNAAQGLFTFATYGLGMLVGTWFAGIITQQHTIDTINPYTKNNAHNWQQIWFVPVYIALAVLVLFLVFFREKKEIAVAGSKK